MAAVQVAAQTSPAPANTGIIGRGGGHACQRCLRKAIVNMEWFAGTGGGRPRSAERNNRRNDNSHNLEVDPECSICHASTVSPTKRGTYSPAQGGQPQGMGSPSRGVRGGMAEAIDDNEGSPTRFSPSPTSAKYDSEIYGDGYGSPNITGSPGDPAESPLRRAAPYPDLRDYSSGRRGSGSSTHLSGRPGKTAGGGKQSRPSTPNRGRNVPQEDEGRRQQGETAKVVRPKSAGSSSSSRLSMRLGWGTKRTAVAVSAEDILSMDVNPNNKTFPLADERENTGKRKFYSHKGGGQYGPMPVFSTASRFSPFPLSR